MKLEIKHLFTYLPYNVKYAFRCTYDHKNDYESIVNYQNINELELILDNSEYYLLLHPLYDLTKEIEVNGQKFVPLDLFYEKYGGGHSSKIIFKEDYNNNILYTPYELLNYRTVQDLFKWHFDVFGLIKNGLAIDINTLNK